MASEYACWPMAPVSKSTAGTWWQSTRYVVATLCLAAGSGISSTICDRPSLAPGSPRSVGHAPSAPRELSPNSPATWSGYCPRNCERLSRGLLRSQPGFFPTARLLVVIAFVSGWGYVFRALGILRKSLMSSVLQH